MTIYEFFENDRFAKVSGVKLLEVKPGYAKASMMVEENHLNGGDVCQGGALFTLADLAFAAAVNSCGRLTFSISSTIHFYKSVSDGILYAEAKEIFSHKRISGGEVTITNDKGELIATFCGSGYRKEVELPFIPLKKK